MYCAKQHNGWLCILGPKHEGEHLSLDNTRMWKDTPGYPIKWADKPAAPPVKPIHAPVNGRPKFTGRPCDHCQSLNTIQNGKCLLCMDCHETGECG
jgi:hypothetical protein